MSTVHDASAAVNSNPDHDCDCHTDRAWIASEAADLRAQADPVLYDLPGFVASILGSLAGSMRWHKIDSAFEHARRQHLDLASVEAELLHRPTKLAEQLEVQASWYLSHDDDAGRLVASELLRYADQADAMGSQSVEEWVHDEAAWQAAACDAVCDTPSLN